MIAGVNCCILIFMDTSEKIKQARRESGQTQAAVAAAAGISRHGLLKIEAGRSDPRASTLRALAKALGVAASELI